jgi:3',5'-cyclic AMP phosphodiesterase CpdA
MLDGLAETNPVLVVPGNHDYAWKGIAWLEPRWQEWNKYLGSPLGWEEPPTPWMQSSHEPIGFDGVGVWKDGPFVYFGVDSGDPENVVRTARGWISRELVENLTAALKKYEGKTRVVFVHHHPFMHKQEMKMVGAQRFLQAVKNNCELLLFGHKHHYGLWKNRDGVPLTIASHRTTNRLIDRKFLAITVIELQNAGQSKMSFDHRLDLVA